MVTNLVKRVKEKIAEEELLFYGIKHDGIRELNAIIPEKIKTNEEEIHIEGENLILDITCDEFHKVTYDEVEDQFVFQNDSITIYIS